MVIFQYNWSKLKRFKRKINMPYIFTANDVDKEFMNIPTLEELDQYLQWLAALEENGGE